MYYINDKLKGVIMIYKCYTYMIKWCLYIVYLLTRHGSLCQRQFDLGLFIDIAYQQHLSDSLPV